ncbi:hypothetical protein H5410_053984 [Solanum commersonii]|uniref:Uncharacterized protein n=1 Tax=Solanum commersonii TaxID=4109 RepID=A0A9J5X7C9_SOLCO|nr:hypothetical protein H5410_053984 [Solanum commersonii]
MNSAGLVGLPPNPSTTISRYLIDGLPNVGGGILRLPPKMRGKGPIPQITFGLLCAVSSYLTL